MTILCPTCAGKGGIPDPKLIGVPMQYLGPNGEGCPQVMCRTCSGTGWVSGDKHCSCGGNGLGLRPGGQVWPLHGFAGDPTPSKGGSPGDLDRGYAVSWDNPAKVSWDNPAQVTW